MSYAVGDEIEFLARLTASMTHEIRNVFAIIQESSGLMGDLLDIPGEEGPKKERHKGILSKIQDQVNRGVGLVGQLNKLAHLADEPEKKVDLTDLLALMVAVSRRLAALREVELVLAPCPTQQVEVETSPFYVSMALHYCLETCLGILAPGARIKLGIWQDDKAVGFRINCEDMNRNQTDSNISTQAASTPQWAAVEKAMEKVNGSARLDNDSCIILKIDPP